MRIPTAICLENIVKRSKIYDDQVRSDIADGFDDSIMDSDFEEFITNFERDKWPLIERTLQFHKNLKIVEFNSYLEKDDFLEKLNAS